ncbi:MAG TPA: ROK family protein [Acidobacteriaceae bacterium]|nr:ROK family protein [Acidobacteriaceae bacterium]
MKAKMFSIGVDLGGTNLRTAAYTHEDGLLETILLPTRLAAGRDAVADDMCTAIKTLESRYSSAHELVGVGVGTPGPLELPAGVLHNPPNLTGWNGFNLRAAIESRLNRPIVLNCDANVAALAEAVLGRGRSMHLDSLCILTLGTGVGNGIILNGKVWVGAAGMAGEAGHATIYPDGPACPCGSNGCLELYASATAVVRTANQRIAAGTAPGLAGGNWTAHSLADAADKKNSDATQIFVEAGRALGIGLATLINTLNLPLYVVGGGLAQAWHLMKNSIFEELNHRSYIYRLTAPGSPLALRNPAGTTHVLPAELGPDAGLLGACILPFAESSLG